MDPWDGYVYLHFNCKYNMTNDQRKKKNKWIHGYGKP